MHEFGELEMVLTGAGILKSWREAASKSRGHATSASGQVDALGVLNLAQAGDPRAKKIIQHRAAIVSDIIVNLSLILNPGLILLGGEVGSHPVLLSSVQKQLEGCEFAVPRIAAATLGDIAVLWGAVAVGLEMIPGILLPQPLS